MTNIEQNVKNAFDVLFDGPVPETKTPWDRWNMSYAKWHRMYVKACDDESQFRHQVETGKFFNEEV